MLINDCCNPAGFSPPHVVDGPINLQHLTEMHLPTAQINKPTLQSRNARIPMKCSQNHSLGVRQLNATMLSYYGQRSKSDTEFHRDETEVSKNNSTISENSITHPRISSLREKHRGVNLSIMEQSPHEYAKAKSDQQQQRNESSIGGLCKCLSRDFRHNAVSEPNFTSRSMDEENYKDGDFQREITLDLENRGAMIYFGSIRTPPSNMVVCCENVAFEEEGSITVSRHEELGEPHSVTATELIFHNWDRPKIWGEVAADMKKPVSTGCGPKCLSKVDGASELKTKCEVGSDVEQQTVRDTKTAPIRGWGCCCSSGGIENGADSVLRDSKGIEDSTRDECSIAGCLIREKPEDRIKSYIGEYIATKERGVWFENDLLEFNDSNSESSSAGGKERQRNV